MVEIKTLDQVRKIDQITLKNEDLQVNVTNLGVHILSIFMKDKNGKMGDVVLGYEKIEDYLTQDKYLGATVGRFANRIKKGTFDLNGKTYHLAINNGPNHLHGGIEGFNHRLFDYEIKGDNQVVFHYLSKDQEEGYPGNLDFYVTYTLDHTTLKVAYHASCDQDTLINMTNHSYFNLSSETENIENHFLKIKSDYISEVDQDGLPTGKQLKVAGTPFDFNEMKQIKDQIHQEHPQLLLGKGYDHPFHLLGKENQIECYHETTGRKLTISTSLPYAQVYSANYLDGTAMGKYGYAYQARDGICFETEYLPDGIHLEENPDCLLKKGENYDAYTSYCFEVIK